MSFSTSFLLYGLGLGLVSNPRHCIMITYTSGLEQVSMSCQGSLSCCKAGSVDYRHFYNKTVIHVLLVLLTFRFRNGFSSVSYTVQRKMNCKCIEISFWEIYEGNCIWYNPKHMIFSVEKADIFYAYGFFKEGQKLPSHL